MIATKTNKEKIARVVQLKKEISLAEAEIKTLQAQLQEDGLRHIEDRDLSSVEIFGDNSESVVVTNARKITLQNPAKFKKIIGADLFGAQISVERAADKYKLSNDFSDALSALMSGEFDSSQLLNDFLKDELKADDKQAALLRKKLKGDYKSDRLLLYSVFGRPTTDYDVELNYIHRIKSFEKICLFFDVWVSEGSTELDELRKSLLTCVSIEDSLKFEVRFEKE